MLNSKKIFFLLLSFSIIFLSYINCGDPSNTKIKENKPDVIQYLALGDSYTIGESVAIDQRWPVQLVDSLQNKGIKINEPLIIAKTGWTTDELQNGIKQVNPKDPFDLVSLLIGVNNQYRGRDAEEYRTQFTELLEQAIVFAGGKEKRVVVLSIPDWGVTPFAAGRDRDQIASEIDQFNTINKNESEQLGVCYVDITPYSREASSDPTLVAGDGLHPSGKMYAGWVRLTLPKVLEILAQNSQK